MTEKGWQARLDPTTGAVAIAIPEGQEAAVRADSEACTAAYEAEFPPPKLTESLAKELYRKELATVTCLTAEGYPPLRPPPSEQSYVAAVLGGTKGTWYAYEAFKGDSTLEIEKKCPQPELDW